MAKGTTNPVEGDEAQLQKKDEEVVSASLSNAANEDTGGVYEAPLNAPSSPTGQPIKTAASKSAAGLNAAEKDATKADKTKVDDSASTEEKEKLGVSQDDNQLGRGYVKSAKGKNKGRGLSRLKRRKRLMLFGGVGVGISIATVFAFFALLPLKVLHIVNNLQSHFSASTENAVQKESDVLFSNYVKRYVLPSAKNCGGVVNKACTPKVVSGTNMVSQLYKSWSTNRLEVKILENYGLEFKFDPKSGHYFMRSNQMDGNGIDLGDDSSPDNFVNSTETLDEHISRLSDNDPEFRKVGRNQLRQAYKDAFANETKWKQVMYRFKVASLLSTKYGLKRCIIACSGRDNFADWKDNKTRAAKIIFTQRVIQPRGEMLGIVLGCVFDGGCDTKETSGGKQFTAFDRKIQETLDTAATKYGTESVADMVQAANDIAKKGYSRYAVDKVVNALIDKTVSGTDKNAAAKAAQAAASEAASKSIPIIGWVNFAAKLVETGSKIGPELKKFSYGVNAATMVSTYMTYRTFADETKSGHVDPAIVGSFASSLGNGDKDSQGGTGSAEETPLYKALIGDGSPPTTAFNGLLGNSAFAAGNSKNVLCNDGNPIPTDKTVCPEMVLGQGNDVANSISSFFNSPELAPLRVAANAWNSTAGKVLKSLSGLVSDAISWIPGIGDIASITANAVKPAISYITTVAVPPIVTSDNVSGGTKFMLAAGGADVSGQTTANELIGGKQLTTAQASAIIAEQEQQELLSYQNKPTLSRLFDKDSNYSLITKVATAMPSDWTSIGTNIASFFKNPFGNISKGFANIFSFNRPVNATSTLGDDPFGVTQYGYTTDDPNLIAANQDPEKYWDDHCSSDGTTLDWENKDTNVNWLKNTQINSDTGQLEHTTTNPCLLLQAAVGSAGGLYDSSLLGADTTTSSVAYPATSTISDLNVYKNPLRDIKDLTAMRVDQGVDYGGSGPVYAIGEGTIVNINNSGWSVNGGPPTFIAYQLSEGPAQGKYVFFAENCIPDPSLKIGQVVHFDTVICTMVNASPHTETGWANGAALGEALSHNVWNTSVDNEQHYTAYGLNFSQLMVKLGAPAGTIQPGAVMLGSLTAGWPTW